jgi:hypothetical protein
MTSVSTSDVREFRFKVSPTLVRSFVDPHNPELHIHHAYVPVRSFPNGKISDEVNPRRHEKLVGRVPKAIEQTLRDNPKSFHNFNRGLLLVAQKAWYDNKTETLHAVITSEELGGLADGATTDRVIGNVKRAVSKAEFEALTESEVPEFLRNAYVHVEIISGDLGDMIVPLTGARNTSNQVKEFALEDLGGGFDWLKEVIESSPLKGRVRYRENDQQPVDVRTILALLTLFHPKWNEDGREPVVAYTSKGAVLEYYRNKEWKRGYETLNPVVVDTLRLYDYVHVHFDDQYEEYKKNSAGTGSKLGKRKEVTYREGKYFALPLTGMRTKYLIPDGWLYPLLASFRMLLDFPKDGRGKVRWVVPGPEQFFDKHGHELVGLVVEQSENLGRNPNATGKSRPLWSTLRTHMELHRFKLTMS